jgi:hypothetical protein
VKDLDEYMKLEYPYETTTDEEGATVVSDPHVPGCSSFSCTGIESALAMLALVRRLWIDGCIQPKANIVESNERGNRSRMLIGLKCVSRSMFTSSQRGCRNRRDRRNGRPLRQTAYQTVRSNLLYEGGTVDLCARKIGRNFPG